MAFKHGDIIMMKGESADGGYNKTMISELFEYQSSGYIQPLRDLPNGWKRGQNLSFSASQFILADRATRADALSKLAESLRKDADKAEREAFNLSRYKSDEEELAATMVAILDSKGKPEERIEKITKILMKRKASDKL